MREFHKGDRVRLRPGADLGPRFRRALAGNDVRYAERDVGTVAGEPQRPERVGVKWDGGGTVYYPAHKLIHADTRGTQG